MILLKQENNTFALTLWEKVDFGQISPNDIAYIFEFTHQVTKDSYTIELQDDSQYKEFYNLFELEIVGALQDQDLNDAKLFLKDEGYYDYVVKYYDNTASPIDLNICEIGIARYLTNRLTKIAYEPVKPVKKQWK
jgi:hypothetical protein